MAIRAIRLSYDRKNNRFEKMSGLVTAHLPGKRWRSSIGVTQAEAVAEWMTFLETSKVEVLTRLAVVRQESEELRQKETPLDLPPVPSDLAPLVEQWLKFKGTSVSAAQIVVLIAHTKFLLAQVKTTDLHIDLWETLVGELNTRKKNGKWSGKYCHDVLVSIKGFYKWASKRITVPAWVFSEEYSIAIPKKKIEFFSASELKVLLEASSEELRAIILIALNTSCTQEDISQLTWDMVDMKQGTLTRTRTKHKHRDESENVLVVTYTLWPEVLAYLKTLPNRKGLLFTRADGSPLVQANRNDEVRKMFKAVTDRIGQSKTFKYLRKSGATALGGSTTYRIWREVYLCNSPKSVTDTSYDGTTVLPAEVTEFIRGQLLIFP